MEINYIDTTAITDDFTSRTVAKVEQEKSTLLDIRIGQRVRISDEAYPGSNEPDDVAARGLEATVIVDMSEQMGASWDGCVLVETDDYDLHYVMVKELEPLTTKEN